MISRKPDKDYIFVKDYRPVGQENIHLCIIYMFLGYTTVSDI